jgi:phenylpyruvate tautomerase PptA (4-oxalocrotonate tautomerase family)
MPLLRIQTNAALEANQRPRLLRDLSGLVAKELEKPLGYVQVLVEPDCALAFAGTTEPTAFVELRSLGLPSNKPKVMSAALSRILKDQLGIPPSRVFLNFFDMPRQHWGWNGTTFA